MRVGVPYVHRLTRTMQVYALIILSISCSCFCDKCPLGITTPEMDTEKNLRQHLTKCYDEILNPPANKDSNTVLVKMNYIVESFHFDSNEEILTLYSWNSFKWQDDRLSWKLEDYQDIKRTQVSSFDIWSPGLKLVNTADADDFDFFHTECRLNSTGYVKCALYTEHKVFCSSDLTNWPYDTKSCTLQFDRRTPQETKVIYSFSFGFLMEAYKNAGWEIAHEKVFKNLTTGIHSVKFDFDRLADGLEASIVVPAFIVGVLTVTALFLDYRDTNRLGILCMSLISHFVLLNAFGDHIPKHSANTPVILLFISRSTAVIVICFVTSFGFRYLWTRKTLPPAWVASYNDFVFDGYGRYCVVTKWEVNEDLEVKPNVEWVNFISIANSVCLFVVIITYISLLSMYIPKKPVYTSVLDRYR